MNIKIDDTSVLYILEILNSKKETSYEYFLNLKSALERFNSLLVITNSFGIEKLKIKAIYGLISSDYLKAIECDDKNKLDELEKEVILLLPHSELIKQYPRARRLRDIDEKITVSKLVKLTGMTERAAEKLLMEEIKFESFSTHKLSQLCSKLNLSVYLFLE